jgi:hypothetical protein
MISRTWRKHKTSIIFGGLILVSAVFSIGDMIDKASRLGALREQTNQTMFENLRIQQNNESDVTLRAIANERMKRGCILVVDNSSAKNLSALTEGKPVIDRKTKSYLPVGVTVCGANGETGVLRNNLEGVPVISDIAVGDRELVYKNLQKIRGAKVYYNTPEVTNEKTK